MLGVKLHGEKGLSVVDDALVCLVVFVGEEHGPSLGQMARIDREAMVLGGDVAPPCPLVGAWLIVTTVAIPEERVKGVGWGISVLGGSLSSF